MRSVCKSFAEGHRAVSNHKEPVQSPLVKQKLLTLPLEPALFGLVQAFVDLQEARHEADYNLEKQWNRLDVLNHIQTARQAFADWAGIRTTPNAAVFLAALLLQKHWGRQ